MTDTNIDFAAAPANTVAAALPEIQKAGAVKATINQVAKSTAALTVTIQSLLIQCAMHAERHGDITLMGRLLGGNVEGDTVSASPLGAIVRTKGLKVYVEQHTPLRWNGDGKLGVLKADAKNFKPFDVAAMVATPFYAEAAAVERTAKPLEFEAIFNSLAKAAERQLKLVEDEKNDFVGDRQAAAVRLRAIIKAAA